MWREERDQTEATEIFEIKEEGERRQERGGREWKREGEKRGIIRISNDNKETIFKTTQKDMNGFKSDYLRRKKTQSHAITATTWQKRGRQLMKTY